ncbi:MurR/RpiR family transcriptional regulator [Paenibacillus thalictri]|uniref:MurR/RpiR family transcriptional regulator n=1 Tax=Paenibacillus thalictri TaxID=2527873 RepID=A0A4Q9DVH6_9BACL|nr:MurR/RpiR family transcriptional regulator [Paenibacillus thalictri]TBL80365.1 MurR/RpiR family transcriptional regulator [Paenibacillus thalictri]
MLNGGLVSIKEALNSLKPTEQKVAKYILEHPEQVVNISVQKLAELAGVSEATIVRLARSLNLKGYQELKLRIAADLATKPKYDTSSYQEIQIDGSIRSLIDSISHNNMQSIQDTMTVLSQADVGRAIEALSGARKINVFGVGASAVIAEDFKQKLTRINRWCETGFDFNSAATLAANMTEQDVVFGISYSGQTADIIDALQIAKANGAKVVSLTKFGSNPVADAAHIRLFTSSLEKSIRSGAMASRIAQLNVIDILYVGIASKDYDESIQSLERTRQAVSKAKRNG